MFKILSLKFTKSVRLLIFYVVLREINSLRSFCCCFHLGISLNRFGVLHVKVE